jgi:hypothetical protein
MGTWSPDVSGLATIAQLFSEYSVVGANQGQIYARLQQCSARPDFNNYLVHLLGQSTVSVGVCCARVCPLKLCLDLGRTSPWRFAKAPACC